MPRTAVIERDTARLRKRTNLDDTVRRAFRWDDARADLAGLPGGAINIAHEVVDRHLETMRARRVALRFLDRRLHHRDYAYAGLAALSNRFAHALRQRHIVRGDRVAAWLPRSADIVIAMIGAHKIGAVFVPLAPRLNPDQIAARLTATGARVLVTTPDLFDEVSAVRASIGPALEHVVLSGEHMRAFLEKVPDLPLLERTRPSDAALMHFTAPDHDAMTTHTHDAVTAHRATARLVLDLHDDDVFWCTAPPGTACCTSYGTIAPLACGVSTIVDELDTISADSDDVDVARIYRILDTQDVSVWYTSSNVIEAMMRAGGEMARRFDLSTVRFVASSGPPLDQEAVWWMKETLGLPVYDTWWQPQTGAIMLANTADGSIRPGAVGRPIPGVDAAIVTTADPHALHADMGHADAVHVVDEVDVVGELALRAGWPSMPIERAHAAALDRGGGDRGRDVMGLRNGARASASASASASAHALALARARPCVVGEWYLTGELARRDADGRFWIVPAPPMSPTG